MEFKFDANQEYQVRAIEAVTGLFEGQPRIEVELEFALGAASFAAVANRLDLDETALLANLRAVQGRNGIPLDDALQQIEEAVETPAGQQAARFPNFSVEMETGTGKTYVYLRTALELFRLYGLRKFVVVVPSVAVREGVLKTLQITAKHLGELYDNIPYRSYVYESDNLSQVRQFALSDSVEIMVMTIDSFNKASNVIRQATDRLQGETPIHMVQATRPVLVLDEPQNMESELSVKALAALKPLFALRYSATHRNPYNLVYRLTPAGAYRQGIVKRIDVAGIEKEDDAGQVFVRLDGVTTQRRTVAAQVTVHKLMPDGRVREQAVTVRQGDSLEAKSGRAEYAGFEVDEINVAGGFVRFSNNVEIRLGEARGADKETIFRAQIRYTIEEHFRKQARLKGRGIKVLSLFFIDRVANYAPADGVIRRLFAEEFDAAKAKDDPSVWRDVDPAKVQAAYFAEKRHRGDLVELVDSVSGKTTEDQSAYQLIMKDKERLLSFDEPVAFIFSHSALREGWDNPNVCQICTLNQTASEMKKRQEIGRGVRLVVDQLGERVRDAAANILTVVPNESYQRYVLKLQEEIEAEYGPEGLPPKPMNARERATARLRKEYMLRPEFKELWERIRQKTRYAVKIDTDRLLRDVVSQVDWVTVRSPRVTITKAQVQVDMDDAFVALQTSAAKTLVDLAGRYPLPNIVDIMARLMERSTPPVRLTRRTLLEVFRRTTNKQAALDNPHEFAALAVAIIKNKLDDQLIDGIQYEKIDDWYEMTQFDAEVERWQDYLVPSQRPDGADGPSLYDRVFVESGPERQFVERLEQRGDVKLYVKLPDWFTVPTPIGHYSPDWAIVVERPDGGNGNSGERLLYLVRETKHTTDLAALRPDEARKIRCGERHFRDALGVDYMVCSGTGGLP